MYSAELAAEFQYFRGLPFSGAGSCHLTDGGEVVWTSDNDEEFAEEFARQQRAMKWAQFS